MQKREFLLELKKYSVITENVYLCLKNVYPIFEDVFTYTAFRLRVFRLVQNSDVTLEKDYCSYCKIEHSMYNFEGGTKVSVLELEEMVYGFMKSVDHDYLKYVPKSKGGTGEQTGFNMYLGQILDVLLEMGVIDL